MDRDLTPQARWQRRVRRWLRPLLLVAGAGAALVWLGGALRPGVELERLRVAAVERRDLEAVTTAAGTVQPAAERVMTSPVDARLLRVLRPAGSVVAAGEALLELDLSATELALGQLDGRLAKARAQRLERRLQLEKELGDLRGRRQISQLELEEARFALEQSRQLHEEGLVSLSTLRASETRARRLEIELAGLEDALANARESSAAQLAGLDAELSSLAEERSQLVRVLERATGRAERAGVVTWVLEDEGAAVRRGDPLARLADLGTYRLEATVSDIHAQRLEANLPVRVPLGEELLRGHVSRVLPAVDEGALRFWVELDEGDHPGLRPNLRLDVQVVTATRRDVLTLAKGTFARGPGVHDVFVLTGGGERALRREITLGLSGDRRWEVTSGLDEGERVIVSELDRFENVAELRLR